jgi:hypothetical protein
VPLYIVMKDKLMYTPHPAQVSNIYLLRIIYFISHRVIFQY